MNDTLDMTHEQILQEHIDKGKFIISRLFMQGDDAAEIINLAHRDENIAAEMLLDAASYVDDAACETMGIGIWPYDRVIGGEAINPFGVMLAYVNFRYGFAGVIEAWSDREMAIKAFPEYAHIPVGRRAKSSSLHWRWRD